MAALIDAVPSASCLALSRSASDLLGAGQRQGLENVTSRMIKQQFTYRGREQVAGFFTGMDLVAPGLVRVEEWRPGPGTSGAGKSHRLVRGRPQARMRGGRQYRPYCCCQRYSACSRAMRRASRRPR